MYVPKCFQEPRVERLVDIMDRYGFAMLLANAPDGPSISHLPLLLDKDRGTHGVILGHVARANPQWKHFESDPNVLAVFTGPHTYVSPTWYAPSPENVPTWNYAVVHARGLAHVIPPGRQTLEVLKRLADFYEPAAERGQPAVDVDTPEVGRIAQGIVAFEIEITSLTGKFKLSQSRPESDRLRIIDKLLEQSDPAAREVASLMKKSQ